MGLRCSDSGFGSRVLSSGYGFRAQPASELSTSQTSRFRVPDSKFRISGLGSWVCGSGFRVLDLEFRDPGSGFHFSDFGFQVLVPTSGFKSLVSGFGFGISGFGIRDSGFGFRVPGFGCTAARRRTRACQQWRGQAARTWRASACSLQTLVIICSYFTSLNNVNIVQLY